MNTALLAAIIAAITASLQSELGPAYATPTLSTPLSIAAGQGALQWFSNTLAAEATGGTDVTYGLHVAAQQALQYAGLPLNPSLPGSGITSP